LHPFSIYIYEFNIVSKNIKIDPPSKLPEPKTKVIIPKGTAVTGCLRTTVMHPKILVMSKGQAMKGIALAKRFRSIGKPTPDSDVL